MNRRTLLKRIAAIPFASFWPYLSAAAQTALPARTTWRRVRPGDLSWPTAASWEKLKQQVGGNLISVQSPLAACNSERETESVLKNLQNPYYVGDQPGATQTTGWVDAWMPALSFYAVAARNTSDVVAAVNFARENNLRLVVKGGGHSYQGTSNAADSLLIWTRAMNQLELHDAFVAQGCAQAPQPAVTIEAGAMWIDAYHAVTTVGARYVQGGGCATVGVAGLIQSGGFGSFSKCYGMAAAALLQAEVVTADGAVCIANASSNPELFWGIKGGGGGSLGVVTKVTLRTRDLPVYFGGMGAHIKANSDAAFQRLIERFISFYRESLFNPHWGESINLLPDNTFEASMVYQGLDKQQARAVWQPFFDWLEKFPQDFTFTSKPGFGSMTAQHWWDAEYRKQHSPDSFVADPRSGAPEFHVWWSDNQNEVGIYLHGYESVWLPASLLQGNQQKQLADALFASSREWEVRLHCNKGLAGAPADAVAAAADTAMNPAVLDAFALAIIAGIGRPVYPGVAGHEPDPAAAHKDAAAIHRSMTALRKVVPQPGSYVSESNFFEDTWQQSFWGANYPRLLSAKNKYDPDGLFFVHHGVGSEHWSADGFARLDA